MKRTYAPLAFIFAATAAQAVVFPTTPHVTGNFIPFGSNQTATMHQVFASSLFSNATGGLPASISSIGFAPTANGIYQGNVTIRLGYTTRIPGATTAGGGLDIPTAGGGGGPNSSGPMSTFFSNPTTNLVITTATTTGTDFSQFRFNGSFVYNPALGNLLVEIVAVTGANNTDFAVSRTGGSAESSRAWSSTRFAPATSPTTATRMDFTFTPVPEPATMLALGAGLAAVAARRRRKLG